MGTSPIRFQHISRAKTSRYGNAACPKFVQVVGRPASDSPIAISAKKKTTSKRLHLRFRCLTASRHEKLTAILGLLSLHLVELVA
jgi:hypothetical protein